MELAGHKFEDRELIHRVMLNLRGRTRYGEYRWVVVRDLFGCGSTVANALCYEFNLDPDEVLKK